jgi:hypothetical protein
MKTATIKRNHPVSDEEIVLLCMEAFEADPSLTDIEFECDPPAPMPVSKFKFIQTDSKALSGVLTAHDAHSITIRREDGTLAKLLKSQVAGFHRAEC